MCPDTCCMLCMHLQSGQRAARARAAAGARTPHVHTRFFVQMQKPDGGVTKLRPAGCPRSATTLLPAGQMKTEVKAPHSDETAALSFLPVKRGAEYCLKDGQRITLGGTLMTNIGGKCALPPVTDAGKPCCSINTWQPSASGSYLDNCSMTYASNLISRSGVLCRTQMLRRSCE